MFYKHVILNNDKEEVLYLYLTNAYEFAQDLENKNDPERISTRVTNYVKNRGISFHGNKIYLVVDGIIVGTVSLKEIPHYQEVIPSDNLKEIHKEEKKDNTIILEYGDHHVEKMSMDQYLLGVLATEILPIFHIEALKAQAIVCRTYALKQMIEQQKILAVNPQQIYRDINYYKFVWTDRYFEYVSKIKKAIEETKGQYLTYQNKIIHPFYHLVSNGKTESLDSFRRDFSYLQNVSSIWDLDSPMYLKITIKKLEEITKLLQVSVSDLLEAQILEFTQGNRIAKLKIGDKILTGQEFARLLGLSSTDVSMWFDQKEVHIITRGIGHGLGMSQYGANAMAQDGYSYIKILYHYYPNTKLWKFDLNNQ